MPNPRLYAGQVVTADRWNTLTPVLITQETDQTVTSSTTYINSEILFTPEPNAIYMYELLISYSAVAAEDFKWQWLAPGATFASFTQARHQDTATTGTNAAAQVIFRRPANTTDRLAGGEGTDTTAFWSAFDRGTFSTDSTNSTVAMQFAQRASGAIGTILRGGNQTRMLYRRIA